MTRKDYIAVAAIIRAELDPHSRDTHRLCEAFAEWFASDNPQFNRARFYVACTGQLIRNLTEIPAPTTSRFDVP